MAVSSTRLVLICGLPASGKSTLARQLASTIPAIRLDKDEWAIKLGSDPWDDQLRVRLERLLWTLTLDLLARDQSVILEWGHWARAERDEKRLGARALGVGVELHFLDAPMEQLIERAEHRQASGEWKAAPMTRDHFEAWAAVFQPPDEDEMLLFDEHTSGVDEDALLDEQLAYYDDRAPIYDDAYTRTGLNDRGAEANERWWSELRMVEAALDRAGLGGDVLELGCGTGRWTQRLAANARTVTALDGSDQMLRLARSRLGDATNVTFEHVDLLRAWAPTGRFDAVAAFFFLEHVPDTYIDRLLRNIAMVLPVGGRLFIAEGLHREPAPAIEHRQLHGHEYRVVERRRREEEFAGLLHTHGFDVQFNATERLFCYLEGTKAR